MIFRFPQQNFPAKSPHTEPKINMYPDLRTSDQFCSECKQPSVIRQLTEASNIKDKQNKPNIKNKSTWRKQRLYRKKKV